MNSESNGKKINNAQAIMHNMNENPGNIPEIVLVSPDEYDKPINGLRKLDLLELLVIFYNFLSFLQFYT